MIDANSGFSFDVQWRGKWVTVIAWNDDGWPMVADPDRGALIAAVENGGIRYRALQDRSGLNVPAEWMP